jgi:predicted phage terminase large subunit-like protein
LKPRSTPLNKVRERLVAAIRRARTNVNAFAALCFSDSTGRPLESAPLHRELQSFLSQSARGLIELPRDHGKSMQVCIRLVWELARRPELRIKIVCASEAIAMERGRFVRDAISGNRRVRLVFPRLQPSNPWEAVRFSVGRRGDVIGPSVSAIGIHARSTGTRADLLVCDDVVDVTALRSRADRESVKQIFRENLINLLEPDGRLWYAFTPWHGDDLSAVLKQSMVYAHFRRGIGPDLEPIWPEHWPRERLAARRDEIGEAAFARAYRLECVAEGDLAIRPEWVQTWSGKPEFEMVVLAVDPAASVSARSDRSAIVALGRTENGVVHCLEATARRVAATDLLRLIEDADRRWRPDVILFENVAGFGAVYDLLAKHTSFGAKLRPIKSTQQKDARIRAFGVHVQNGRFLLLGDGDGVAPGQIELYDELIAFPHGQHDDLADAAAFGSAWLLDI